MRRQRALGLIETRWVAERVSAGIVKACSRSGDKGTRRYGAWHARIDHSPEKRDLQIQSTSCAITEASAVGLRVPDAAPVPNAGGTAINFSAWTNMPPNLVTFLLDFALYIQIRMIVVIEALIGAKLGKLDAIRTLGDPSYRELYIGDRG